MSERYLRKVNIGKDCSLCDAWGKSVRNTNQRTTTFASKLWETWDTTNQSYWQIAKICQAENVVVPSLALVKRHFSHHNPEQPAPVTILKADSAYARLTATSARQQAIVSALYRLRVLGFEQIVQLFYSKSGRSLKKARDKARIDLMELARLHFIYRFSTPEHDDLKDMGPTIWFLGRNAVPWIAKQYDRKVRPDQYITTADQVGLELLPHDLGGHRLWLALAKNAPQATLSDQWPAAVYLSAENWYGPKHLRLEYWENTTMKPRAAIPDGFATLSIELSPTIVAQTWQQTPLRQTMLLPFFYEYDRGGREAREVAEQLLQYHTLALSKAIPGRFPELNVQGYTVPVLMVFRYERRLQKIVEIFRARALELGLRGSTALLLTTEDEWRADPYNAPLLWAWQESARQTLIPALLRSSHKLVARGNLWAESTLQVNPKGGLLPLDTWVRKKPAAPQAVPALELDD